MKLTQTKKFSLHLCLNDREKEIVKKGANRFNCTEVQFIRILIRSIGEKK